MAPVAGDGDGGTGHEGYITYLEKTDICQTAYHGVHGGIPVPDGHCTGTQQFLYAGS